MKIDGIKYTKEEVRDLIDQRNDRIKELMRKLDEVKQNGTNDLDCLVEMFNMQYKLQKLITGIDKPVDSVKDFHYSMTALVTEIGEVLSADKRWKTHRNDKYDFENKIEEFADCFAFLINAMIYSGIGPIQIYDAFVKKNAINIARLEKP
ncbi:dUTP diphosphatase [Segatella hominis]|jgi:NTP pyrophosphatase (non-canonical NTP hydrolase)|uniref:dUTP diphosphatase n=1 Tax=Segatella hominis TaxID=2518605 RepID=UPI00220F538E|nr:MAG: dUTPase [Bacteriophage sp.]